MEPQKLFMANILQGAIDAGVISLEDVFRHIPAEVLSRHVPSQILWGSITEGMARAGLGFGDAAASASKALRVAPVKPIYPTATTPVAQWSLAAAAPVPALRVPAPSVPEGRFEVTEGDVAALFDRATGTDVHEKVTYDVTEGLEDEMSPISEEGIIVEEVDWNDKK
jgi:hypothetical protein